MTYQLVSTDGEIVMEFHAGKYANVRPLKIIAKRERCSLVRKSK